MPEVGIDRWAGSWVTDLPEEDLVLGDFKVLDDFVYGKAGYPVVRPGWRPLDRNLSSGHIKYLDAFESNVGPVLMVYTDPTLQSGSTNVPSLWAWNGDGTLSAYETSGLDNAAPGLASVSSCSANTWWVFTYNSPGDNRLLYWDGALTHMEDAGDLVGTIRQVPNAPQATKVFYEGARIWVVTPDEPSTLYGSARDAITDWTVATNQAVRIPVNPGDGGKITSINSFGGDLWVFKDSARGGSVTQLAEGINGSGDIVFSQRTVSSTIGAVSDRVVIVLEDRDVIFGSRRALHSLVKTDQYGDVQSSPIDVEISSLWRQLSLPQKRRALMLDDWQNDRILMSYDSDNDGTNDRVLYLHYARYGPPRVIQLQEQRFPSFSRGTYGFDTGTVFTFGGNLNGAVVAARNVG